MRAPGRGGSCWAAGAVRLALVLFGFMPLWSVLVRPFAGLSELWVLGEAWFAFHCHRDPARSVILGGHELPVCTRCLGIYLGLGLGALLLRPRLAVWPLRIWVLGAALLMLLDVSSEFFDLRPGWAPLRLMTGLLLAYPVGGSVVWAVRGRRAGRPAGCRG